MNRVVSYTVGLVLAAVLTLTAFGIVSTQAGLASHVALITTVLTLAMVQLIVQLIFFLHIGRQKDSQWNTALFAFTFFAILVIVVASVWIMYHLNRNMTPTQVTQYINDQSSF